MSYEQKIHVEVTGLEQGERAIAQTAALEERTKRLAAVIADRIAGDEKLLGKQLDLIKAETVLEGLREKHRMQNEALAASTNKAADSQEKLNTATRKGVSDVQAASAALRAMEGSLSIRAVEQFTTKMLGMGPAMQALFPLVGAVAFLEVLGKGAEKLGIHLDLWHHIEAAQKSSHDQLTRSVSEYDTLLKKSMELEKLERRRALIAKDPKGGAIQADQADAFDAQFQAKTVKRQDVEALERQLAAVRKIAGIGTVLGTRQPPPTAEEAYYATLAGVLHTPLDKSRGVVPGAAVSQQQSESAKELIPGIESALRTARQAVYAADKQDAADRAKADEEIQRRRDEAARKREAAAHRLQAIEERIAEIRKRAEESSARTYFGSSLEGRAAYDQVKLQIEEASAISKTPSRAREISGYYTVLRSAAYGENQAAIARRNMDEGFSLDDVSRSSLAKHVDLSQERLDSRELRSLLLSGGPTVPAGYRTARQELRDVQDSERRYMSLSRVSGQLAGQSEGGQISSVYSARTGFADAEYKARIRDLTLTDIQRADALEAKNQKIFDAQMEREQSLMEIALRQKEAFQKGVVGLLSAARSGGAGGVQKFLQSQLEQMEDTITSNAAGMAWKSVAKIVPHAKEGTFAGDLLKGTPFGPDPLKTAGVTLNSAGVKLSVAAEALMRAAAARSAGGGGGLPSFGGGGGGGGSAPSFGGGGGISDSPGSGETDVEYSGLPGGGVNGDYAGETSNPAGGGRGAGSYAASAGGAAYGIYSAVTANSTKGKLSGAGDALLSIGPMLPPPAGPIVMAAGAVMKGISLVLPDHKKQRAEHIAKLGATSQYLEPARIDAVMTTSGAFSDFDRFGGVRGSSLSPFPGVQQGFFDYRNGVTVPGRTVNQFGGAATPPQVNVTVNALDARSVLDRHQDIASAVLMALDKGHTGLSERLHGN